MKKLLGSLLLLMCSSGVLTAAPVLQVDANGQLFRIKGVLIDTGSMRVINDVSFHDGSCIDLFIGCDDTSRDLYAANIYPEAANAALLQAMGNFLDTPHLIRGCDSVAECYIVAPSEIHLSANTISAATLWVRNGPNNDVALVQDFAAYRDEDFKQLTNKTYAIWTPTVVSTIPLPTSMWLFVSGLLGMVGCFKKRLMPWLAK